MRCKRKFVFFQMVLSFFFLFPAFSFSAEVMTQGEITEAGTYPVEVRFRQPDGVVITETYYVTITYLKSVVSNENAEAIDAHDILVHDKKIQDLTDQELIELTHAKAWNTTDGLPVVITDVIKKKVRYQNDYYEITFKTAKGTSTTITAVEAKNINGSVAPNVIETTALYIDIVIAEQMNMIGIYGSLLLLLPLLLLMFNYLRSQQQIKKIRQLLYEKRNSLEVK